MSIVMPACAPSVFCTVFSQFVDFVVLALFAFMPCGIRIKWSFISSTLHLIHTQLTDVSPFVHAFNLVHTVMSHIHFHEHALHSSMCVCFSVFLKFICINLRVNGIHIFLPKIQFAQFGLYGFACSSSSRASVVLLAARHWKICRQEISRCNHFAA